MRPRQLLHRRRAAACPRKIGGSQMKTPLRRKTYNLRLQGIALALDELARTHVERDLALMVLDTLDLTIAGLEAAGADDHDLEPLKK